LEFETSSVLSSKWMKPFAMVFSPEVRRSLSTKAATLVDLAPELAGNQRLRQEFTI
jgi:hypothetical protein